MLYIGIDPGKSGAAVALRAEGSVYGVARLRDSHGAWFFLWAHGVGDKRAAVEKVGCNPKFGAKGNFGFGVSVGELHTSLYIAGVPWEYVTVGTWQKILGPFPKGESKRAARAFCERLWPDRSWKHSGEHDAACIAEWLRRRELGGNGDAK